MENKGRYGSVGVYNNNTAKASYDVSATKGGAKIQVGTSVEARA
jgi:hypothetical protein